jgi:hypothetical protein
MLYKEIITVCFQIHTKHIRVNTLRGQNIEFLLNPVVYVMTLSLSGLNYKLTFHSRIA